MSLTDDLLWLGGLGLAALGGGALVWVLMPKSDDRAEARAVLDEAREEVSEWKKRLAAAEGSG